MKSANFCMWICNLLEVDAKRRECGDFVVLFGWVIDCCLMKIGYIGGTSRADSCTEETEEWDGGDTYYSGNGRDKEWAGSFSEWGAEGVCWSL